MFSLLNEKLEKHAQKGKIFSNIFRESQETTVIYKGFRLPVQRELI